MGNKVSLDEQLIDLRITSKQMQRSAKKCEKNEKAAIEKLKKVRVAACCCGYCDRPLILACCLSVAISTTLHTF